MDMDISQHQSPGGGREGEQEKVTAEADYDGVSDIVIDPKMPILILRRPFFQKEEPNLEPVANAGDGPPPLVSLCPVLTKLDMDQLSPPLPNGPKDKTPMDQKCSKAKNNIPRHNAKKKNRANLPSDITNKSQVSKKTVDHKSPQLEMYNVQSGHEEDVVPDEIDPQMPTLELHRLFFQKEQRDSKSETHNYMTSVDGPPPLASLRLVLTKLEDLFFPLNIGSKEKTLVAPTCSSLVSKANDNNPQQTVKQYTGNLAPESDAANKLKVSRSTKANNLETLNSQRKGHEEEVFVPDKIDPKMPILKRRRLFFQKELGYWKSETQNEITRSGGPPPLASLRPVLRKLEDSSRQRAQTFPVVISKSKDNIPKDTVASGQLKQKSKDLDSDGKHQHKQRKLSLSMNHKESEPKKAAITPLITVPKQSGDTDKRQGANTEPSTVKPTDHEVEASKSNDEPHKGGASFSEIVKLYEIRSKKIQELTQDQLLTLYNELKPTVLNIFEGRESTVRQELYSQGAKAKNELFAIDLSIPFDKEKIMTLLTYLFDYLIPIQQRSPWSIYIGFVLLPETMIRIYAKVHDIPITQAETEMRQFQNQIKYLKTK